jgi:hypothetical protein
MNKRTNGNFQYFELTRPEYDAQRAAAKAAAAAPGTSGSILKEWQKILVGSTSQHIEFYGGNSMLKLNDVETFCGFKPAADTYVVISISPIP